MTMGNALADRNAWLFHVRGCASCPGSLCTAGRRLAYAVAASMDREESWSVLDVPATPSARSLVPFPWAERDA
jgi:hypothetical protein